MQPGEAFYSVLVPQGAEVVRQDFAADAWKGPPDDAIGWWRSEVSDPRVNRPQWAPHDVILNFFEQLQQNPVQEEVAYVLALLMIRRRIFKLEASETDTENRELLLIYCSRNEKEYRVVVSTPSPAKIDSIQRQLTEMLFATADQVS